jgi:Ca2+-binding EF-hand superfamily protein
MFDNNGDNRITFNEFLLSAARDAGTYIDLMPKKVKDDLRKSFDLIDVDRNGVITEDDLISIKITANRKKAD